MLTGVSHQWWSSNTALRMGGVAPGCSPDLFPGGAQLQGRHGLPQHAAKGSLPAPQPACLLLLPLSLPRLCFLQQLRAESTQNRVNQEGGCPGPPQVYLRRWEVGVWAPTIIP